MKLNKFALAEKMSLQEIRTIKAGCAYSQTGGNSCVSASSDSENAGIEFDR